MDSSLAAFVLGIADRCIGRRPVAQHHRAGNRGFQALARTSALSASMETFSPIAQRRNIRRHGSNLADISPGGERPERETRLC